MDEYYRIKVDGQTHESWSDCITKFTDASIYQTWAYGVVRWGSNNLSHLVMLLDNRIVAAAQLRIARLPFLPGGVAYLRWGPLCHLKDQLLNPSRVTEMVKHLREEYCGRRGLTLQIIPNAYSDNVRSIVYKEAFSQSNLRPESSESYYRTILVDLEFPVEVIRKRLDQKWRNQLNRAEKNNLILEASDGCEAYREFVPLYNAMLNRKQFETSVDVEEFYRIQKLLSGTGRMQTFLAKKDGQSIAGLVISLMGDTAVYLLGATNERARDLKAAYFLQWQAMMWMKDRGTRWYDLGGIDHQTNPGGYHFKSGFGGNEATQLPPYSLSKSVLGGGLFRLAIWLRRHRNRAMKIK